MRVLLVEDSPRLQRSLSQGLRQEGFVVDATASGAEGLWYATENDYDVIVLDWMLPELDGISLLRALRAQGKGTHVLILSAKDLVEDRVQGLDAGADDYLTKPFAFTELCARVRALVRRGYGSGQALPTVGGLELDLTRRRALVNGAGLELSPQEFGVLETLLMRQDGLVSQQTIIDRLYGLERAAESNVVAVVIHRLRKKLRAAGATCRIENRPNQGYTLTAKPC